MSTISNNVPGYGIASMITQANAGTTSTPSASGSLLSLLQSAGGNSGLFGALSGTSTTLTTNIFSTLGGNSSGGSSISSILNEKKVQTQTNAIYQNIAQRLTAMQNGSYQPQANWEKVADYCAQTGQPVVLSLDSKGAVQATPQAQASLSQFNVAQQNQISSALSAVATMASKIQSNQKNDQLVSSLDHAGADIQQIAAGVATASQEWERQGVMLLDEHHPFTISLDSSGNIQIQDQVTTTMSSLTPTQQTALRKACESAAKLTTSGYPTTQWQATAQSYDNSGIPYYLSMDPTTSVITTKENSGTNIVPSFLKTEPYPDIGDNTPMMKNAANFIQKGQAFFLGIGSNGQVAAMAATEQNMTKYNNPGSTGSGVTSSVMSIIA